MFVAVESVQCAAFGVPTGQVFGLLGANGAGKTTTVSMVCRAVEPTSGDAKVAGKSVLADFEDAARALGCVEIKILRRVRAESSRRPPRPSTRCLLDGVAMPVPRRSTEPGRPRHCREMT